MKKRKKGKKKRTFKKKIRRYGCAKDTCKKKKYEYNIKRNENYETEMRE